MKKRIPAVLIIALALIIALGGVTVAEKINLFNTFSNYDDRLPEVAEDSMLEDVAQAAVETPELGVSTVTFTNAHFDGENIVLGYTIENLTSAEYFVPTEEELSAMRKSPHGSLNGFWNATAEQDEMSDAYHRAVELGIARGVKGISILPTIYFLDENGERFGDILCYEFVNRDAENVESYVRIHGPNYDPLPESIRDSDRITVEVTIYQYSFSLWNDGEQQYKNWNWEPMKTFSFTVLKSDTILPHTDFAP